MGPAEGFGKARIKHPPGDFILIIFKYGILV